MAGLKTTVGTGLVTALALFAGIGAAQQVASEIDVDQLAKRLTLSQQVKEQIAPQVERLNAAIARRADGQWSPQLRDEFWDARTKIEAALNPDQRTEFWSLLHETFGFGPNAGARGFGMGSGCGSYGSMGYGSMHGGGMGYGPMHGSGMGYGPMHDGSRHYGPMHGSRRAPRGGR